MSAPFPQQQTIGHGKVMPPDTRRREVIRTGLHHMAEKVAAGLRKHQFEATRFYIGIHTAPGWQGHKFRSVPTDDGQLIRMMCDVLLREYWNGQGAFQVQITALDPKVNGMQTDWLRDPDARRRKLNRTVDTINERFGEFTAAPAPVLSRPEIPNAIATVWRSSDHRGTVAGAPQSPPHGYHSLRSADAI